MSTAYFQPCGFVALQVSQGQGLDATLTLQSDPVSTCCEPYKLCFRNKRIHESDAEWQQALTLQSRTMISAGKARGLLPTCRNSDLGSVEET